MTSLSRHCDFTTNASRNEVGDDDDELLGGDEIMARSTVEELRTELSTLSIRFNNHERECADRMTYIRERLEGAAEARRDLREEMQRGFQDSRQQNGKLIWLMLMTMLSVIGALITRYVLHS